MPDPRTVTTITGQTFILLNGAALGRLLRSPTGPVMRRMLVLGEEVKVEMIRLAPRRTGNLANHIVKRIAEGPLGPIVLVGVENVDYVQWVVQGTVPHDIYPRNAKVLAWQSGGSASDSFDVANFGNFVFRPHVHHPGTKPNPFMTNALKAVIH